MTQMNHAGFGNIFSCWVDIGRRSDAFFSILLAAHVHRFLFQRVLVQLNTTDHNQIVNSFFTSAEEV